MQTLGKQVKNSRDLTFLGSVEEVTRYSTDDNTDSEDDSLRDRLSDADFPISDDDYCEKKESDEEVGKTSGAGGWANSIAKVLKTNAVKDQKSIVLSKAKKQDEIEKKKEKKAYDFQIDGADTNEDLKPDDDELELEILKNRYKQRIAVRFSNVLVNFIVLKTFIYILGPIKDLQPSNEAFIFGFRS